MKQQKQLKQTYAVQLTRDELEAMTEGALLSAILLERGIKNRSVNPHKELAILIKKTRPFIAKCLADKAHLGILDWYKIEKNWGTTLKQQWCAVHFR